MKKSEMLKKIKAHVQSADSQSKNGYICSALHMMSSCDEETQANYQELKELVAKKLRFQITWLVFLKTYHPELDWLSKDRNTVVHNTNLLRLEWLEEMIAKFEAEEKANEEE